jgi:hypothetical protein
LSNNTQNTVQVYKRVTTIIWQRLSPTFGIRTINAIAKNSIARKAKQHPSLSHLRVGADGIEWDGFESHLTEVDSDAVSTMLDDVMDEFFDAVATLIGRLVVGKIMAEAEEAVQKETRN